MADIFRVFRVYKKTVERRVITDEGAFVENNVPDDYGGPQLTLEMIQRVVMTDSAGYLLELRFDDLVDLMDADRQKGVGADILDETGEVIETIEPAEGVTLKTTWQEVVNDKLSESETDKAKYVDQLKDDYIEVVTEQT